MQEARRNLRYSVGELDIINEAYQFVSDQVIAFVLQRPIQGIKKVLEHKRLKRTSSVDLIQCVELRVVGGLPQYFIEFEGKWQEYAKFIWRRNGYRIPQGARIDFINGKTLDVRLSNLTLVGAVPEVEPTEMRDSQRIVTSKTRHTRKHFWNELLSKRQDIKTKAREAKKAERDRARAEQKKRSKKREAEWSNRFLDSVKTKDTTIGKRRVRVDSRTVIYVDPSVSDEEAIGSYLKKHKRL